MSKKVDESVIGKRTGHSSIGVDLKTPESKNEGLELSDLVYKPISFFAENPINFVFDKMKDEAYFLRLKKDIDESRAILNPLITMPDGLLVEGHGRLAVARELEKEGHGLGKLPVRIILSSLTETEIKQRVYLGNLSRFEINEDVRIQLYAEIWPDYFLKERSPGKRSYHGDTISVHEMASLAGKSVPQLKRDAAIYRRALKETNGIPDSTAIKKSRTEMNVKRKSSSVKKFKVTELLEYLGSVKEEGQKLIENKKDLAVDRKEYVEGVNDTLMIIETKFHDIFTA